MVKAFRQGKVIISCKNAINVKYDDFNIEVKCNHEKKFIKTVEVICTKTSANIYESEICNIKAKINIKPHDQKYTYLN